MEKNSLKVTSPESIKGVYECAIGNFGVPQYGGTLVGTVVYPKANQGACKSFDDFDISFKSKPGGLPTFLLVDRGGLPLFSSYFLFLSIIDSPILEINESNCAFNSNFYLCNLWY